MQLKSTLPQEYQDLQSRVRVLSREQAAGSMWCRNPQNNDQKLGGYFKPRVNILIRPPYIKTGEARKLVAGSGEILFHIYGSFDSTGFVANPQYRLVCGERCPTGLDEMIDSKLEQYEPIISMHLHRDLPQVSVKYLYSSVYESLSSVRRQDAIN